MIITLLDCETTGLNPREHEIIEIAAVKFDSDTFVVLEEFEMKAKPLGEIDPKAQEVNGYTPEEWEDAHSLDDVMHAFSDFTMGTTLMAYNYHFDLGFIEEACRKCDVTLAISRHKIDLLSMAFTYVPHHKVTSWSMKTVCTVLRVPPEPKIHRAMNGVMAEFGIYKEIMRST